MTNISDCQKYGEHILSQVSEEMFGVDDVIKLCLVALHTGGHILLEGNPGFGKTDLVKAISEVLGFESNRIQFTPDLMPADITGTFGPDFKNSNNEKWTFNWGPIFTNLLLADEINRATPKTQSAMLEAMAENQVTVLGEKYELSRPFFVLATQNPIDQEGTYQLPEAQSDRFMFKVLMPQLDENSMNGIIAKTIKEKALKKILGELESDKKVSSNDTSKRDEYFQEITRYIFLRVKVHEALSQHVLNIYFASNGQFDQIKNATNPNELKRLYTLIEFGLGPRAVTAMIRGAKAWSSLFSQTEEDYVATGDSLAPILIPILRHRLKLKFDWERSFKGTHDQFLREFCEAALPRDDNYKGLYKTHFRTV